VYRPYNIERAITFYHRLGTGKHTGNNQPQPIYHEVLVNPYNPVSYRDLHIIRLEETPHSEWACLMYIHLDEHQCCDEVWRGLFVDTHRLFEKHPKLLLPAANVLGPFLINLNHDSTLYLSFG
jgi:hypothetical protein